MMKKLGMVLFVSIVAAATVAAAGEARTMFLGDSITHLGFCEYYLQLFENLRHPGSATRYYNVGFGGGTLQTGIANCKHEIERVRPSRVVVMFGMNDIGWSAFETNEVIRAERKAVADKCLAVYRENCGRLLSEIRGLGVTNIVLATPTPYDEYSWASPSVKRRNVNEYGLKGMAGIVRETARAENLLCVDLNAPMTEMAARHPEIAWCGGDRVHPGRLGYLFMATQYLAAFGEIRPVASVGLTSDGKIVACENAKVDGVARSADGLSFAYRPQALPFPPLPEYKQLKSLYPKAQKINCETLIVKGLREGTWRLCADGRELGVFSARQFADGVNLAELDTPNRRIAAKAAEAMTELHDFDQPRRDRACVRRKYESFGVPMDDKRALKGAIDKYLAKLKADKYSWYDWEEKTAGKFLDAIGRDDEILAEEERLYRAMADVRPVAVRIEIKKAVVPDDACAVRGIRPGELWHDTAGHVINAHGGGVIFNEGVYWWYGEHKVYGEAGNRAHVGVHVYSSTNLLDWTDRGIALAVSDDAKSDIADGCILERPKVLRSKKTGKFVMYFHLELKGREYRAARTGIAVADSPEGPFVFVRSLRPTPGSWPTDVRTEEKTAEAMRASRELGDDEAGDPSERVQSRVPYLGHIKGGQMSRDMTLFEDDDGRCYHIFASEYNSTLHIAELADDLLGYTGRWFRLAEKEWTEAPAICKHGGWYFLIGSGCTGWKPNQARLYRARKIDGPWERLGNPCRGVSTVTGLGPELTWGGQSTFFLPVAGSSGQVIAMFDVWHPENHEESRYVWLPVTFENDRLWIDWQSVWTMGKIF